MEQPPYDIQRMGKYVGIGLVLGTAVGIVIGTVLNSIGMGVAFGAGIGLIVGDAWGRRLGGSGESKELCREGIFRAPILRSTLPSVLNFTTS